MSTLRLAVPARVFIGLGSNMGDRQGWLEAALAKLAAIPELTLKQRSSLYETEPIGPPQDSYLNLVQEASSCLGAPELLGHLLRIEAELGRVRQGKWGPRNIDLDLLLFGAEVIDLPGLKVPHPELHRRGFVLVPLAEIAPELIHPVLELSVTELAAQHPGGVQRLN